MSEEKRPCVRPCTDIVKFMTDKEVPANVGISIPPYTNIDGYSYINIFVRFTQEKPDEPPVDLGVMFAFDEKGTMRARRYVNLEANLPSPQHVNFIEVSGEDPGTAALTISALILPVSRSWDLLWKYSSITRRPFPAR